MDRSELERLDRESLVTQAQAVGIKRARVLTRPELIDELLRLDPVVDPIHLRKTRGFFGLARDLLSRVVERGLHLPDAADRLRDALGPPPSPVQRPEPQAVPTVTLAEIYAAQGHKQRAIDTLKRVIEAEPDHAMARGLLERLEATDYVAPPPPLPPEAEERSAPASEPAPTTSQVEAPAPIAARPEPHEPVAIEAEEAPVLTTPEENGATLADPPWRVGTPNNFAFSGWEGASSPEMTGSESDQKEGWTDSECVAIPVRADALYVHWRISTDVRRSIDDRTFVVRALVIEPAWDGPRQEIRDVEADPDAGALVLTDLPAHAIVRVAVGFVETVEFIENGEGDRGRGAGFVPVAHSPALEVGPGGLVHWTLEGSRPVVLDDPTFASVARATRGAVRVAMLPS